MLNILVLTKLQSLIISPEIFQYSDRNYAYYLINGEQIPLIEIVLMLLNPQNYLYPAQCTEIESAL